jgi:NAD-dependent SIR2 family protein deacetylase
MEPINFSDYKWPKPKCAVKSKEINRPDYNDIDASEYLDSPEVLEQKMELLAKMIRQSKCTVAYTGAGISKASGIPDYATKATNSLAAAPKIKSSLDALPTFSHLILTAMDRKGLLHAWVQQNHDGLPQKAGYPQEKLNEIHGAWFDPSNPVVQFNESLRTDLFNWMLELEKKTELCLCLGTSLSGMNADRMAKTPAKKFRNGQGLGTVIINLQRTHYDDACSLRVWAKLDDAFKILAAKLGLNQQPIRPLQYPSEVFKVPYNAAGELDWSSEMTLDLRPGSKLRISAPGAMNFGAEAEMMGKRDDDGHWQVFCESGRRQSHYILGWWWPDVLMRGAVPHMPMVNIDAEVVPRKEVRLPKYIELIQTHNDVETRHANSHNWGFRVSEEHADLVESVTYTLHPTFHPPVTTVTEAPFEISRLGWGTFTVHIDVQLTAAARHKRLSADHYLSFRDDITPIRIRARDRLVKA